MSITSMLNIARSRFVELMTRSPLHKFMSHIDTIEFLTYSEAIKYFINNKPNDLSIVKGTIVLLPSKKRTLTVWAFIDKNNDVVCDNDRTPYGRKIFVDKFDSELEEAFGNSKILIIE